MSRAKQKRGVYAHGCPRCGQRYEARGVMVVGPRGGMKPAAGESGPCLTCRTGQPLPWWPEARLPRDCCRAHSRLVRPDEMETYSLAPGYPWYICQVCYRTFPRKNPATERDRNGTERRADPARRTR